MLVFAWKRLLCRVLGCRDSTARFDRRGRMALVCPRCGAIEAGEEVARDLGLVRKG